MQRLVGLLLTALFCSAQASACPLCSTSTGAQVRAGIFNEEFISTMLVVLAPIPVFIGIVLLIHFGLPWRRESRRTATTTTSPSIEIREAL